MPEANTLTKGDIDLSRFEKLGEVVSVKNPSEEEFLKNISDADVILINKSVLSADVLSHAKNLKYIG